MNRRRFFQWIAGCGAVVAIEAVALYVPLGEQYVPGPVPSEGQLLWEQTFTKPVNFQGADTLTITWRVEY